MDAPVVWLPCRRLPLYTQMSPLAPKPCKGCDFNIITLHAQLCHTDGIAGVSVRDFSLYGSLNMSWKEEICCGRANHGADRVTLFLVCDLTSPCYLPQEVL